MNEKTQFYFKRLPSKILKAHTLIDNIDRGLLVQFALFHPKPCFLSVDYLTEVVLGCGEKAFYRSVLKLQFLGLIQFKRGSRKAKDRKRPNHYTLVSDPKNWRLPKPLSDEIKADYAKLAGGELVYEKEQFPNELGFKIAFNKIYPKYAIKFKHALADETERVPVRAEIAPNDLPWFDRLDILTSEHCTPSRVVADFYKNKDEILKLKVAGAINGVYERKYLTTLEGEFVKISNAPPTENVLRLLSLGIDLENRGMTGVEIGEAIKTEAKNQRMLDNRF